MSLSHLARTAWQHGIGVFFNMSTRKIVDPLPHWQEVTWDEKKNLFYLDVQGLKAIIKYKQSDGVLDLVHTRVPTSLRHQGIAGILAKGTFVLIKEKKLRVKLSCNYLHYYYKNNKTQELTDILVEEQKNLW